MLYIIKFAFRNIFRNRRRSILAILSVLLAMTLVIFLHGMIGGIMESLAKNSTKNESGHVQIVTKEFRDRSAFMPVDTVIENPQEVIKKIEEDEKLSPKILTITERVRFGVLLNNDGRNKTAFAVAGDAEKEKSLLMLQNSIVEGRYIEGERETIIGSSVAEALKLSVGDTIKVVATDRFGGLNMRKFEVVGIFKSGLSVFDDMVFQIPIEDAKVLLRYGNSAQQVLIMLNNYNEAPFVAKSISKIIDNDSIDVGPWTEVNSFGPMLVMIEGAYNFIYFTIALLGVVIIANIMMMVVMERRHEIGIMKAIGISPNEVLFIFLFEGMMLGIIGSVIGLAIGTGINFSLSIVGMDFSSMMDMQDLQYPMDSVVYNKVSISGMLQMLGLGTIVSAIVSVLPARFAAKLEAVKAIRSA